MRIHTSRHAGADTMAGHAELEDAINVAVGEVFPKIISLVDDPDFAFSTDLIDLLEEVNITAIPEPWIQRALISIAESSDDESIQNALKILEACISGRAFRCRHPYCCQR